MIEVLTQEEFNAYAKEHPCNTFFQSSYWGELKSGTGWISHIIGIKENGTIKGATLLLGKKIPFFNRYFYYAPRGFLIDYQDKDFILKFTKEVAKYVKKNRGIFFKMNPYLIYQQRDIDGNIVDKGYNNKDLITYLKKIGYKHNGFTITYGKDLEPRWLSVLDIEGKTEEEILRQMRPTTRSVINNSYKYGLSLTEIGKDRLEEFKNLMVHTGERRGFIDRPLSYYEKMYESFKQNDNIKVILVELNLPSYLEQLQIKKEILLKDIESLKNINNSKGKRQYKEFTSQLESHDKRLLEIQTLMKEKGDQIVVAGGLFMTFGTQVLSLFGASYKEYMKFGGQYFLNYEMIKYGIKNDYKKYNFYGITGEFNEESPMFGLFDFKRGFHAEVTELVGEFTYITNKLYYFVYQFMFFVYKKLKKWRKH